MKTQKLYNTIDRLELIQRMKESEQDRTTISFYKYHQILNPDFFRNYLYFHFDQLGILGRIYVAYEGINAQISVPDEQLERFKECLNDVIFLQGIRLNYAIEDDGKSFFKLIIKIRKKIVADGIDDPAFNASDCGVHLNAREFNEIISEENTILVDMRNHYESEVGHFVNARLPEVVTFRESLPIIADLLEREKGKNLVMYCTGGIRCEKASAYMKFKGFKNVYQLNGGIIEYARQVKQHNLENKFIGKNFVFDERLGERISEDIISHCHQCGKPCDHHVNCKNDQCHILFIQCPECAVQYHACCSKKCDEFLQLPKEKQEELKNHVQFNGSKFSKGRYKAHSKDETLQLG